MHEGIITECIAMHSKVELAPLSAMWYGTLLRSQPLGELTMCFVEHTGESNCTVISMVSVIDIPLQFLIKL